MKIENIEFKSQVSDELYKEVIAFANTDGVYIYRRSFTRSIS